MKRGIVFVGLAVSVLFLASSAYAEKAITEKQIALEEKQKPEEKVGELQDIKNPEPGFKVELWADRKDPTYKVGDEVKFFFKANKDCYLTLLDVGTSGKTHIIFPNKHQKENLVKAGTTYQVPAEEAKFIFKANGPSGEEVVKAIATLKEVALLSQADVKPAGDVQEVTKPESQVAKDIAIALKPVNTNRWTEAELVLKIEE